MTRMLVCLALALLPRAAVAQVPQGEYPGVGLSLTADGTDPAKPLPPAPRALAPTEITCHLDSTAVPIGVGNLGSRYFLVWFDPLSQGQYCQADITADVQPLQSGLWYAELTFFLPPIDGRVYPMYYTPSHEFQAFAVGTFLRPPTNLTIKADQH